MKKSIIAFFLACLLSTSVQAAIVDDGNYFKDTITGYTWMDLTTYDLNTYSYNQVQAEILGTEFQFATLSLLEDLWLSTYIEPFDYLYTVMGGVPNFPVIAGIFDNELENNTAGLAFTWNNPISWNNPYAVNWILESQSTAYDDPNYNIKKDRSYIFGFWLVDTNSNNGGATINPVPEPSTLLLSGAGLIGLAALRRARRS